MPHTATREHFRVAAATLQIKQARTIILFSLEAILIHSLCWKALTRGNEVRKGVGEKGGL